MAYRITRGDLEITKNVVRELVRRKTEQLSAEIPHFEYETECPSYDEYQALIDSLVFVEKFQQDLTN